MEALFITWRNLQCPPHGCETGSCFRMSRYHMWFVQFGLRGLEFDLPVGAQRLANTQTSGLINAVRSVPRNQAAL